MRNRYRFASDNINLDDYVTQETTDIYNLNRPWIYCSSRHAEQMCWESLYAMASECAFTVPLDFLSGIYRTGNGIELDFDLLRAPTRRFLEYSDLLV